MSEAAPAAWADAAAAADLLAVDPVGLGGARLRGRPSPARDAWLARLKAGLPEGAPFRKAPAHVSEERLLGGLDLGATLSAGRPVARRGLMAECDGGAAVLAMAERAGPAAAAHFCRALDEGRVTVARDGVTARPDARLAVIALDEGAGPEEAAPPALRERLAFDLALDRLRLGESESAEATVAVARAGLGGVSVPPEIVTALCEAAEALGVASPRATLFALRAARAAAALAGRAAAGPEDAALAARLTLGHRATLAPTPEAEEETPEETPPEQGEDEDRAAPEHEPGDASDEAPDPRALADLVLAAAQATLPAGLLAGLKPEERRGRGPASGAAGALRRSVNRGRPIGARPGRPEGGARLDLVETLRAAAPWQPLRRRGAAGGAVLVRAEDFRVKRFKRPAETLTLFAVDASGSAAFQRLAEAKGAVELLLAESYVRRDRVALVVFRGRGAELALPPTRSLTRAKRLLAGLPGGGGTPLALGLDLAAAEAEAARRRGWTPTVVLLTDGRANVDREGAGGRARAEADALDAARRLRLSGVASILLDAAPRADPRAAALAEAMGGRYLPLPRADAAALGEAAKAARR